MKQLLWKIALIAVCASIHQPLHARELYFEAKVTSGPISDEIRKLIDAAEKSDFTKFTWSIKDVCDFNKDGVPDVVLKTFLQGLRGLNMDRLILEKGIFQDKNVNWKEWSTNDVGGIDFWIGDLDNDGDNDIAYILGYNDMTFALFEGDVIQFIEPVFLKEDGYLRADYAFSGDYDGDGLNDILQRNNLYISAGDFTYEKLSDSVFPYAYLNSYMTVRHDINKDLAEDILCWQRGEIIVFYGNQNREKIFSEYKKFDMSLKALKMVELNASGVDKPFACIHSATEFIAISIDSRNDLDFSPIRLPDNIDASNSAVGDVNNDGDVDLICWTGNVLDVCLGDGVNAFERVQLYEIPYFQTIVQVFIRDANRDGLSDLITFSNNGDIVTLYQLETPPPTPTSTPTPYVPNPNLPTPTSIALPSNALIADPTVSLEDQVVSATDDAVFYFYPGDYFSNKSPADTFLLSNIEASFVGIEPQNRSRMMCKIQFCNSDVLLQNLAFDNPLVPGFQYYVIFDNTNLILTNCFFRGGLNYVDSFHGYTFSAAPSSIVRNCVNKTILFKDNEIEAGDSNINVLVENCQDTTLDLRENPMLGIDNRIAHVQIVDSTNVTVLLRDVDNPYYPRSLTTLTVSRSTVNVIGGVIRGYDGLPDVVGENGGYGIRANEGSTVTLQNVEVAGGRGGDGIEPGRNGPATLVDETSAVLWESAVNNWELH